MKTNVVFLTTLCLAILLDILFPIDLGTNVEMSVVGIGAAIGAGASLVGGLLSAHSRKEAMRKQKRAIEGIMSDNEADYYSGRGYSAEYLDAINRATEAFKSANQTARGVQAVMGGSEESVAAQQGKNADALARTISSAAAVEEQRKMREKADYENRKYALENQLVGLEAQKDNSDLIGMATAGVAEGAGTLEEGLWLKKYGNK